jgi:hypothetical protein
LRAETIGGTWSTVPTKRRFQLLLGELHWLAGQYRSVRVEGIGGHTELGGCQILLGLFLDEADEPGHRANGDDHDAGGKGVECAGVTHLLDAGGALDPADDGIGRHTTRLVDNEEPPGHR